ncbi:MAG TPA: hypothetical protein ENG74_03300, partial [Thermoplasmatales archaeon]|nr:hypothetical protein [Thermoplasmatales archaeon]
VKDSSISKEWGRIYVKTGQTDRAIDVLRKVFGVVSISPAVRVKSNLEEICKKSIDMLRGKSFKTFAVRASRTGEHNFTSQDVATTAGDAIRTALNVQVDLDNPDVELFIEVRGNNAYLYTDKIRGPSGLPVGTQGKVLAIVRKDRDILAMWFLLKRGCKVIAVTVNMEEKIERMVERWYVKDHVKIIPIKNIDVDMIEEILSSERCLAVVAGDGIKDLARTLYIDKEINFPVMRPLLVFDDTEIRERMGEIMG